MSVRKQCGGNSRRTLECRLNFTSVYWSPYLLDWPGLLPQGNRLFSCPAECFPGLTLRHSVCPFLFHITVAHLRKKKKKCSVPLVLFAHFRMPPQCQPAQQWNQYFLSHSKGQVLQKWWILDRTLAASETAQKSRRPHLDQAAKVTAELCVNIGCFQWPLQPNLILQSHFRAKQF